MLRPHTILTLVLAVALLSEVRADDGVQGSISDYQQARQVFWRELYAHGGEIRARQAKILKRWNRDDAVSVTERRRNDLIERLQGNRNPFIDDPRAVDRLRF